MSQEIIAGRDDWLRQGGEDLRRLKTEGDGMRCGQLFVPNGTLFRVGHIWSLNGTAVANCTLHEADYVQISRVPIRVLEPILEAIEPRATPNTEEGDGR